jgi:excisionase family DNA binding protein
MERILHSKREAAQALGLSVRTVECLIARRELIARRVGKRVLISSVELQRFAKKDHATQDAVSQPSPMLGTARADFDR